MKSIAKWIRAGAALATASYAAYAGVTWLRYRRVKRATGDEADLLLDSFMPEYEVDERHAIVVQAPPDVTLAAAKEMELEDSPIVRAIFKGRELIFGSTSTPGRPRGMYAGMQALGWGVLAETEHEVVFGAVTKPWQANPVFRPLAPQEFAAFAEPDHVKIAWTLRAGSCAYALVLGSSTPDFVGTWAFVLEPAGDGATRLITRYRAAYEPSVKMAVKRPWMAALHAFMERKQLRTIKERVEHLHDRAN